MMIVGYEGGRMALMEIDRIKTATKLFRRIRKGLDQLEEYDATPTHIVIDTTYKKSMLEGWGYYVNNPNEYKTLYGVPVSFKNLAKGRDFVILTDSFTEEEARRIIYD